MRKVVHGDWGKWEKMKKRGREEKERNGGIVFIHVVRNGTEWMTRVKCEN